MNDIAKERIPIPVAVRRQLYIEAGYRCPVPRCTAEATLEIHHIDENPSNNDPLNLLVLCANHHGQATKGAIDRLACRHMKDALVASPVEAPVDHEKLANLLAAHLKTQGHWPQPVDPSANVEAIAAAVDQHLGLRPEILVRDQARMIIWVQGTAGSWDNLKTQLLGTACIVCKLSGLETIEVGASNTHHFVGTAGGRTPAIVRFAFSAGIVENLVDGKTTSQDVWRQAQVLQTVDENTTGTFTSATSLASVEARLR